MNTDRTAKPTIDAINDAVAALSGLLHSLRAHARAAAEEAKKTDAEVRRHAATAGRRAARNGKKVVRKAGSRASTFIDKAARVWNDIVGPEEATDVDADTPPTTRAPRAKSRAKKPRA
jgi:uncharacterized protein YoxC